MSDQANFLRIGDIAPDFETESTTGPIKWHEYLGESGWGLLCSHPADFTPVCTTELGAVANLQAEWAKRGVKVAVVSVDPLEAHNTWKSDINETQKCSVEYPILADENRKIANLYTIIHPNSSTGMQLTVRSVFFIGPGYKIRAIITYPASVGRSFPEIIRVIDALQLGDKHAIATPVNWTPGQDVIIPPSVSTEAAQQKFGQDQVTVIKPYLRTIPCPP